MHAMGKLLIFDFRLIARSSLPCSCGHCMPVGGSPIRHAPLHRPLFTRQELD
jgi:hypothetical protein